MTSQRPLWWMYVVAASYLCIHLIQAYLFFWGPANPVGLEAVFESGAMRVRSVESETPFARVGLLAGDQVLRVSGLPIQSPREWAVALANVRVGRPDSWEVLRSGDRIELAVIFERATLEKRFSEGVINHNFVFSLVFLPLGLLIGFRRPHDLVARIGAWLFLTASVAFGLLNGWAVVWRQLPAIVQLILWIPEVSRFVIEGIFLSFFVIFPRRMFHSLWPWFVIWIPVLATLPWRVYAFYSAAYGLQQATAIPPWLNQVTFLRLMLYVAAALVVLLINYRWLSDINERRRIRVLMVGTAIGLAASALPAWSYSIQGYALNYWFPLCFSPLVIMACPFAFGYAILRHRVFDIQVIIRQGLQYALARGAVLGVVPALAAMLVVDLAVNSQEPLANILRARGWEYAGGGGLAFVAYFRRKQWLEALDRRFFREHYDSQRVLNEIVDEVREASSFDRVAARVVARIETALHPEFVSVMIHEQTEREYRCMASVPTGRACPPIKVNSKLVTLLRVLDKPLEVLLADSAWLQSRLPEEEIAFVQSARIDLLVPIRTASTAGDALLALGIKRSEEPYTREDQELLEAIASSLARLLEQRVTAPAPVEEAFEECRNAASVTTQEPESA